MAHNRKYVPGGFDYSEYEFKYSTSLRDQNRVEKLLIDSNFFEGAPFTWVGLLYRYWTSTNLIPEYKRIDKKDGELPLTIELDSAILHFGDCEDEDSNNLKLVYDMFMIGAIEALIHVGNKYKLNTNLLIQERAKFPPFPLTIEDASKWDHWTYEERIDIAKSCLKQRVIYVGYQNLNFISKMTKLPIEKIEEIKASIPESELYLPGVSPYL